MPNVFIHQIYINLVHTAIALLIILLVALCIEIFFVKKIEGGRYKKRVRKRVFYISAFILLFILARIWVEGFTHILAVLGLVSAALVVTNKETIMNIVGWLIITWRDLFSEDDLIQVQQYKGYVKSMGMLYFTLLETSEKNYTNITGRVIRIPNGLISTNALLNFSQNSHLLEQKLNLVVSEKNDMEYLICLLKEAVTKIIADFYTGKKEYTMEYLSKQNKQTAKRIDLVPRVLIEPKWDKPGYVSLEVFYYCFSENAEQLQQKIWLAWFALIRENEKIELCSS